MPLLTRLYLFTALGFLSLGFTFGALVLLSKAQLLPSWGYLFLPLHIVATNEGWVLLLIMGVAYWIFPRFQGGGVRGRFAFALGGWVGITLGVLFRMGSPFLPFPLQGVGEVLGWGFELLGIGSFLIHILPRIKPVTRPALRRSTGEQARP